MTIDQLVTYLESIEVKIQLGDRIPPLDEILSLSLDTLRNTSEKDYETGYARGYDEGQADGYEEGYEEGFSTAYDREDEE